MVIHAPTTLGILTNPGLLYALIPFGVIILGIATFELAMAITISTLPRSRFQHKWTPQEQRRVLRVFAAVFCAWPIIAALILSHVYLPLAYAIAADVLVFFAIGLGIRWILNHTRQRKLIMAGHCANCLYDLRASHESERCPECGTMLHDHPSRVKSSRVAS